MWQPEFYSVCFGILFDVAHVPVTVIDDVIIYPSKWGWEECPGNWVILCKVSVRMCYNLWLPVPQSHHMAISHLCDKKGYSIHWKPWKESREMGSLVQVTAIQRSSKDPYPVRKGHVNWTNTMEGLILWKEFSSRRWQQRETNDQVNFLACLYQDI